jgi:hypothetical protein
VTCKHNKSVEIVEKLASLCFESFGKARVWWQCQTRRKYGRKFCDVWDGVDSAISGRNPIGPVSRTATAIKIQSKGQGDWSRSVLSPISSTAGGKEV